MYFVTIVQLFTRRRVGIAVPIASGRREILPRRVGQRLRVLDHVGIRVHPLRVALLHVRRQEDARYRIIIARDIIIKLDIGSMYWRVIYSIRLIF
jgi:hypothetical protein